MTKNSKSRRGFAAMNAEQLKAISSRGGKASRGGGRKKGGL